MAAIAQSSGLAFPARGPGFKSWHGDCMGQASDHSKALVGIRAAHQSKHRATGYGRLCESQQHKHTHI